MTVPKHQPFPFNELRHYLQLPGDNSGAQMLAYQDADGTQDSVQGAIRARVAAEAVLTAADTALDGRLSTAESDINALETANDALLGAPTITVGPEVPPNLIRVSVQLKTAAGENAAGERLCRVWLSDSSKGAITGTAPAGTAIGTAGVIVASDTALIDLRVITNATGAFNLDVSYAGPYTWYLCLEWQGLVYASAAITFV